MALGDAHLHLHLDVSNSCNNCCPSWFNSTPRMIPQGPNGLAAEPFSLVKRAHQFFCCGPSRETNRLASQRLESLVKAQCGSTPTALAERIVEVDLQDKIRRGDPLYPSECRQILEKAEELQRHQNELKRMIQHLRLYEDSRQSQVSLQTFDDDEPFVVAPVTKVTKRNGSQELFDINKIKAGLETTPLEHTLPQETIDHTVENVKRIIEQNYANEISTVKIRDIVLNEIKKLGTNVQNPSFIRELSDEEIKQSLRQRKGYEELTGKEAQALLDLIQKKEKAESPPMRLQRRTRLDGVVPEEPEESAC